MRNVTTAAILLAVLATAACGSSDKKTSTQAVRTCTSDDVKVSGAAGTKPQITIPTNCIPGDQLLTKDLIPGTAPEVKAGSTMDAQYVLVTWSNKKQVDSSWERGQAFTVENIGHAQVIDGWNEGLIGMKQGGRRLLIVPASKGYGPTGNNGIKGGETLVFVVDAVKVT